MGQTWDSPVPAPSQAGADRPPIAPDAAARWTPPGAAARRRAPPGPAAERRADRQPGAAGPPSGGSRPAAGRGAPRHPVAAVAARPATGDPGHRRTSPHATAPPSRHPPRQHPPGPDPGPGRATRTTTRRRRARTASPDAHQKPNSTPQGKARTTNRPKTQEEEGAVGIPQPPDKGSDLRRPHGGADQRPNGSPWDGRPHGDGRRPGPDSGLTAVVIVLAFANVVLQTANVVVEWMT